LFLASTLAPWVISVAAVVVCPSTHARCSGVLPSCTHRTRTHHRTHTPVRVMPHAHHATITQPSHDTHNHHATITQHTTAPSSRNSQRRRPPTGLSPRQRGHGGLLDVADCSMSARRQREVIRSHSRPSQPSRIASYRIAPQHGTIQRTEQRRGEESTAEQSRGQDITAEERRAEDSRGEQRTGYHSRGEESRGQQGRAHHVTFAGVSYRIECEVESRGLSCSKESVDDADVAAIARELQRREAELARLVSVRARLDQARDDDAVTLGARAVQRSVPQLHRYIHTRAHTHRTHTNTHTHRTHTQNTCAHGASTNTQMIQNTHARGASRNKTHPRAHAMDTRQW
jgi:hypothetical protein